MDIYHLKYFLTLSRELNYSKSAEQLYISRQALRKAIRNLEEDVGVPLFTMHKNKLCLTLEGKILAQKALSITTSFDELHSIYRDRPAEKYTLQILVAKYIFPFLSLSVSRLLDSFEQENPLTTVDLIELDENNLIHTLLSGQVELGILTNMGNKFPHLHNHILQKGHLSLYVHKDNPLFSKSAIAFNDLRNETILLPESLGPSLEPFLNKYRLNQLNHSHICFTSTSEDMVKRVRCNQGVGFGVRDKNDKSVPPCTKHIPFADPDLVFNTVLAHQESRTLTPIAQVFVDFVKKHSPIYADDTEAFD